MKRRIDLTKSQEKQLEIAKKNIEAKKPVCLYGEAGIGKTTMAYILAERLDRQVIEINASDEREKEDIARIMRDIRMFTVKPVIFLFDEVDYFGRFKGDKNWRYLLKIIKLAAHPVIMTANDKWKMPNFLQKDAKTGKLNIIFVRVYPPRLTEVSQAMKEKGHTKGLNVVNADFRASENALLVGGQTSKELNIFEEAKRLITNSTEYAPLLIEKYKSKFKTFNIWLLDNANRFYTGKDLYDVFQMLSIVDITNTPELLTFLPKGRGPDVKYPNYFTKRKIHGKWKNNV